MLDRVYHRVVGEGIINPACRASQAHHPGIERMPNRPNWTEVVRALAALASLVALGIIAFMSYKVEEKVGKLTFPVPPIEFHLETAIVRHWFPQNASIREEDTTFLHVTGYSKQKIIIDKLEAIQALHLNGSSFSVPSVTFRSCNAASMLLLPDAREIINQRVPLRFDFSMRAGDPRAWTARMPMAIGLVISISWFEFDTRRYHNTIFVADTAFIIK